MNALLRKYKKPVYVFLFISYILGLFFIADIFLGRFFPLKLDIDADPPIKYMFSPNRDIGYEFRPGVDGINSDGLSDREYPVRRQPGIKRIAVIGDSIAYGMGDTSNYPYAKVLEQILDQGSSERVEVINFGVPGYGTAQITERFKDKGLKYSPDIVIYGYWFNDYHKFGCGGWEYPFFSERGARAWETYVALVRRFPWISRLRNYIFESELFKRIFYLCYVQPNRESISRFGGEQFVPGEGKNPGHDATIWAWYMRFQRTVSKVSAKAPVDFMGDNLDWKNFREYWRAFEELSLICRQHSMRLILLITPVLSDLNNYQYMPLHQFMHDMAGSFGVEVVDTFDDFRKAGYSSEDDDECHFTNVGHAIVGKALADYLNAGTLLNTIGKPGGN